MTEKFAWVWRGIVPAMILMMTTVQSAQCQTLADRRQEVEAAFDHYADAKTDGQRAALIDYFRQADRQLAAEALVDHIISSRTGIEATAYNQLVEILSPEGCAAVLSRLGKTDEPVAKGKLVVALRHCKDAAAVHALEGCLNDTRAVPFESRGPLPRRVCDLAYDELFLKLRTDPRYGMDPSRHMKGVITEKTPIRMRDAAIAALKAKMNTPAVSTNSSSGASPSATPGSSPGATSAMSPGVIPPRPKAD